MPNTKSATTIIQNLRDNGVAMSDRTRTAHIDCFVDGVIPYSDDVVIAAIRLAKSWDHPSTVTADLQRAARAVIRTHLS